MSDPTSAAKPATPDATPDATVATDIPATPSAEPKVETITTAGAGPVRETVVEIKPAASTASADRAPPPGYEPLRKPEPPKSIVDHAIEWTKAYTEVLVADLKILWVDIEPGVKKFAAKQKYTLIGLVVFILLLMWIF